MRESYELQKIQVIILYVQYQSIINCKKEKGVTLQVRIIPRNAYIV